MEIYQLDGRFTIASPERGGGPPRSGGGGVLQLKKRKLISMLKKLLHFPKKYSIIIMFVGFGRSNAACFETDKTNHVKSKGEEES